MYELIQLSPHDYYIDCPTKIGIINTHGSDVVAVDSGIDKDAGKKLLRIIQAKGWNLTAVYNTHSHADHIGANKYLHEKTGCRVYAPGVESAFSNYTFLEPSTVYGGFPFKQLRHKFLMAQACDSEPLENAPLPEGMEILRLPGHSFDMVGYKTGDNNIYIGDSVLSAETLEKHRIGFLWDVEACLDTLCRLEKLTADNFIPSHAEVCKDISALARYNAQCIMQTAEEILTVCQSDLCFEDILQRLFDRYDLTMNAQQYALLGSTLRSYLAWLCDRDKAEFVFSGNKMLWRRK